MEEDKLNLNDLLNNPSIIFDGKNIKGADGTILSSDFINISSKGCYNGSLEYVDNSVERILKSALESNNEELKDSVDIVLRYLYRELDKIISLDSPLETFIDNRIKKLVDDDQLNEKLDQLIKENINLRNEINDLKCRLNYIDDKLNEKFNGW